MRRRPLVCAGVLAVLGLLASGCGATSAPAPNIVATSTRVAKTRLGAVGYREVGSGPTLVLLTGFGAGMDDWAPYFVDDLARHFRVVELDNAGVGRTASLPAPLSIPAMASQTNALIDALGIKHADVLGWSMGGLIAQALAVVYPEDVHELVLAATQAGTGHAVPVPAEAQTLLDSGNAGASLGLLFPGDQVPAMQRYAAAIGTYPDFYGASAATRAAQEPAVARWFAGDDAAGRDPGAIKAPTLVADGTEDDLNPVANDRMLARLIPGARLKLYPGAGHAFLFQDSAAFVSELRSFLG